MNIVLRDTYSHAGGLKNPVLMALGAHVAMFIWNPIVLPAGTANPAQVLMQVEYRETLPEMPKPVVEPPKPKVVEKPKPKPVVKAKKAGLNLAQHKAAPIRAVKKVVPVKKVVANPLPRSRPSMVKMPRFVPRASDEDAMISAAPTRSAKTTGLRPASNPFGTAPKLSGKSRGVRMADVNFQLKDRGGLSGGGPTVAIPIGEERGETAAIAAAPELHDAPKGRRHISNSYQAPLGEGVGELAGKNRTGYVGRVQIGMAAGPSEEEIIAAGTERGEVSAGQGFEMGGPVGDRKIVRKHLPEYPAWAEEKGITAMVKIFFTVKADGSIRQSVRVVRSSGYTELDQLAKEAILAWKFSPTQASSSAEEAWGVITFRFTLA